MGDEIGRVISRTSTMRMGGDSGYGPTVSVVLQCSCQGGPDMLHRRTLLLAATAASLPLAARAQEGPIVLGSLTPLTGAGCSYRPIMRTLSAAAVQPLNHASHLRVGHARLQRRGRRTH